MRFFPPVTESLFHIDNASARQAWFENVVEQSRDFLASEGDLITWMFAFQDLRKTLLQESWQHLMPASMRESLTYIRFGSTAREEDLLVSDLDFAIVSSGNYPVQTAKTKLSDFIKFMASFGFPPCKGFVMGTNPRWFGTVDAWKKRIAYYAHYPTWENARYLFIMMDGNPLYQQADTLWHSISTSAREAIRSSSFICWEMAHLGIHKTVVLDSLAHVKTDRIDSQMIFRMKDGLLNPILHSLRLLCVSRGSDALRTSDRLDFLVNAKIIDETWRQQIWSAIQYGWRLRLLAQLKQISNHLPLSEDVYDVTGWRDSDWQLATTHLQTAKALERYIHKGFPKPR